MTEGGVASAAVPIGGGVWLAAAVAEPVWRALRAEIQRRQVDGGRVRPEIAETLEALRAAAFAHLTDASGRPGGHAVDLDPPSAASAVLPTEVVATRLGVSARHVRRVAAAEGIAPLGRNRWRLVDVEALIARRR